MDLKIKKGGVFTHPHRVYLQHSQPHSQLVPVHSSPQEHSEQDCSVQQADLVQQEPEHASLDCEFNAYNTPEPAKTTKLVNKMIFFFMII